jgi:simple sugar transport system substrate-binding protein
MQKRLWLIVSLLVVAAMALTACQTVATPTATEAPVDKTLTFGMLLVGPYNDHGYSEAHFVGGQYVEANVPNTKMVYVDKVNSADRPGTTPAQLAEELVAKGATVVIFNSDDM